MEEMHVPTLTLQETVARMRAVGISTSESAVANALEQGLYPFGIAIQMHKSRKIEVYAKLLEEYLAARAV